jgi:hypothetical protein
MFETILVLFCIVLFLGSLPTWRHSEHWGYYPSGGLGMLVFVLTVVHLLR